MCRSQFAVLIVGDMHNLRYRRAAAVSRLKLAVLMVGDLRRLRYRRALTAHPIDVVLYSGIIKRILQTVEVCSILFCGCEPLQTRRSDG